MIDFRPWFKRKTVLFALGLLVVAVFFLGYYWPVQNQVKKYAVEIKRLERNRDVALQIISAHKERPDNIHLISEDDVTAIIDQIMNAARRNDINFDAVMPQDIESLPQLLSRRLPIELQARSTYKNLSRFLSDLENFDGSLVVVDSFRFVPDEKMTTVLQATIWLSVYLKG